ncbi:hypothetical protein Tco_1061617, partial [Tanacetum coccineum]
MRAWVIKLLLCAFYTSVLDLGYEFGFEPGLWQRLPENSYTKEVCQFEDQRLPANSYTKEVYRFGDQRLPANPYSKEVCQSGDQRLPANSYAKE